MADQIIARNEGTTFQIVPAGQYNAVCCDVIDLGIVETTWKGNVKKVHKCALVFQLDELNDEGKRFEVAERFTVSMYDAARLRKFLGDWRGKPYSDDEAEAGAPLHKLEGVNALVQIVHNAGANGKTYANVGTIMKAPKGSALLMIEGYTRSPFWKKSTAEPEEASRPQAEPEDDDDLPF